MSLLLRRRSIARAVLGDLSPREEDTLRGHLRRCEACRAYYDELGAAAAAMGTRATAREQARLFAVLDQTASGGSTTRAAAGEVRHLRRGWLRTAAFVMAPAAALVLWRGRTVEPNGKGAGREGVMARGNADGDSRASPGMVLIYASRKTGPATHGPVRLVAEVPGSGEGRVSIGDYLQLNVSALRAPAYVRVVAVDDMGGVHPFGLATAGAATPLQPADKPIALGSSVELGRGHRPGRLRILALFSSAPIDDAAVRAAVARPDQRGAAPTLGSSVDVVTGLLIVEP
jgi:hypothetical protein